MRKKKLNHQLRPEDLFSNTAINTIFSGILDTDIVNIKEKMIEVLLQQNPIFFFEMKQKIYLGGNNYAHEFFKKADWLLIKDSSVDKKDRIKSTLYQMLLNNFRSGGFLYAKNNFGENFIHQICHNSEIENQVKIDLCVQYANLPELFLENNDGVNPMDMLINVLNQMKEQGKNQEFSIAFLESDMSNILYTQILNNYKKEEVPSLIACKFIQYYENIGLEKLNVFATVNDQMVTDLVNNFYKKCLIIKEKFLITRNETLSVQKKWIKIL